MMSRSLHRFASMRRSLSSMSRGTNAGGGGVYGGGGGQGPPAPESSFLLYGQSCLLKLRLSILPRNENSPYQRQRDQLPRLMLEFTRKLETGQYDWSNSKRMMLTTEEVGLLIDCTAREEAGFLIGLPVIMVWMWQLIFRRGGEQGVQAVTKAGQSYMQGPPRSIVFSPGDEGDWTIRFMIGEGGDQDYSVKVSRGSRAVFQELIRSCLPTLSDGQREVQHCRRLRWGGCLFDDDDDDGDLDV